MRMRQLLSVPVLFGLFTVGCIIEVANRGAYDGCTFGDTCGLNEAGLSTFCQSVSSTVGSGALCTRSCSAGSNDCGPNSVCVVSGGFGQCYRLCTTLACPAGGGTICKALPLNDGSGFQTQICVPGSSFGGTPITPVTTVAVYNKCDPGNATLRCASPYICQRSAVASRGVGYTCTQACTDASQCPGGTGFAACVNGFCSPICSNPNAFDARCAMFATSCVSATNQAGQPVSFCAP